jgi:hypothetical protein
MTDMSNSIGASNHPAQRQNEMIAPQGRFTVHFSATNNRGIRREEDKIVWHEKKREKMTFKVADLLYLQSEDSSEMVLCPILWGINLSHNYAREVR